MKENISLEAFGNFALPREFHRRAAAIVNNTIRPLEMELFDQVPSIIQDSQKTVTEQYQQLLDTSSSDFTMTEDLFVPTDSSGAGVSLPFSGMQNTAESNSNNLMGDQWTLPEPFDFDPFLDLWTPPHKNHPVANGDRSTDSGFSSSLSCLCIGACVCHTITDCQSRTPQLSQPRENPSQTKDSQQILSFLQSIKGSISALEKRLQVPESLN
jgi:hypothetical protein